MFSSIVAAVLVLGFLIIFHELGHFLVAKRVGVGVLKFSIGFGPRLVGRWYGATEYVISAIPLGGFVKMVGEDPEEEVSEADREYSFNAKPLWKRTAIVLAGPVANLLLGFIALTLAVMLFGVQEASDEPRVAGLVKNMPAQAAGLQIDDLIVSIDGEPIDDWNKLHDVISGSEGKTLTMTVDRDGARFDVTITPKSREEPNVYGETKTAFRIGIERPLTTRAASLPEAVINGAQDTLWWSQTIVVSVWKLIQGKISTDQIGGPILIVQTAGKQAERGFEDLLRFMAVISINLAILNLLPIPILDGGHLLFFLIEGILRRPLAIRHREIAQQVGLVLLVGLMAFAIYNDIARNVQDWWG